MSTREQCLMVFWGVVAALVLIVGLNVWMAKP